MSRGGGQGACCARTHSQTIAASIAARASMPARIEWSQGMSEDNIMDSTACPCRRASRIRSGATRRGVIDRSDRGRIVVSGQDRAAYLQGLLTNDIAALKPGEGCYAAYLTPQGRMIADLWVYELGDVILLTMSGDVKETVLAKLDQFIFTEDVQLGDVTEHVRQFAVVGPGAAKVVAQVLDRCPGRALSALGEHGNVRAEFAGQPAIVARVTDTGEPGFRPLRGAAPGGRARRRRCARAGAAELDAATAEALRIEAGVPMFHRDMDEETIPLEAGIEGRRHQPDERLLCRAGSDHSRAASRPRPRRAEARGPRLEGEAFRPPGAPSSPATARSAA